MFMTKVCKIFYKTIYKKVYKKIYKVGERDRNAVVLEGAEGEVEEGGEGSTSVYGA
jgi:hypothetical protein